ncbi:11954_t:CDS:2 [Diversispora eburnea]|uniref:11954_t:CDS:1 n=1 Tax=Diversispora eburnea TaxID=1213867 RepID=A0A9N8YWS1_9GLOM|nr:11954_t:CDS:2 [Diversispora eburnea]
MANNNNSQPASNKETLNSQPIQYNNIGMPLPSQLEKLEAEFDKKAKKKKLKSLLEHYDSKAKYEEGLERDVSKLQGKIQNMLNKYVKSPSPQPTTPSPPEPSVVNQYSNYFIILWNNLISIIVSPFILLKKALEKCYYNINWTILLSLILIIEFAVIGLIWTVKRSHHTHLYAEPYEAVVHGTFGVDETSWNILGSIISSIQDFFAEMMNGGRGFGSPGYDGFVPI